MENPRSLPSIYEDKLAILRSITSYGEAVATSVVDSHNTLAGQLQKEVCFAYQEQQPFDILEICSGETLGRIGMLLERQDFLSINPDQVPQGEKTIFDDKIAQQADSFLHQLEGLIQTGNPETVAAFLTVNRKLMGFCTDSENITRLGQVLSYLYRQGLLEKDSVTIAHYPGSFNPFPHIGHAEVAEQVTDSLRVNGGENPRVVVSTVTRSTEKPIEDNFLDRVDNLVRGFVDHEYVSVLGIPSDLTRQDEVIEFRQLVAQLDSQKKGRHVMGSDTLLSRLAKARQGDPLSNYLINSGNTLYLSIRGNEDHGGIQKAIDTVRNEFDSEVIILPPPQHTISGTMIRELDFNERRYYAASTYVRISDSL